MPESRKQLVAETWGALLQVHAALVPSIDRKLRRQAGIALGWYDVLLELQAAPDRRLTMSQLGERVVLSRTRTSRVVDELVAAGLVAREPNPADARSAFAVLTQAGFTEWRRAAPIYLTAIEEEFAQALTDTDLRRMRSALTLVRLSCAERTAPTSASPARSAAGR